MLGWADSKFCLLKARFQKTGAGARVVDSYACDNSFYIPGLEDQRTTHAYRLNSPTPAGERPQQIHRDYTISAVLAIKADLGDDFIQRNTSLIL